MASPNVLPSSLPRETRGEVLYRGEAVIPCYCANCGAPGPHVSKDAPQGFICYLCDACAENPALSTALGFDLIPDEVHAERCRQAQLEREGRELTPLEIHIALSDPSHYLSKLQKERPR